MFGKQTMRSAGLRILSVAAAISAVPIATRFGLSPATAAILFAILCFIVDRWLNTRAILSSLKGDSEEAIKLTAELTYRVARHDQDRAVIIQREDKFRRAFDHAAIGMAIVSMSGDILKVNRALAQLVGFSDSELRSTNFEALLPDTETAAYKRELTKLFYGAAESVQIEQRLLQNNGDTSWVVWTASLVPAAGDEPPQYIFQFQDITDKKRAQRRLAFDALHDALTGLPNRTLFLDRLQVAFRHAQRGAHVNFAVCYLDFDRFKLVNDSFGHAVGDQLLVEVAGRLRSMVPTGETIARLGGDEFAILIENIRDVEEAVDTSERIRSEMARPFYLGGKKVQSTVSIGIAPWMRDYDQPELLLRDADTALSHAKHAGRDRCEVFSSDMRDAALRFLENETDLRGAVERNEFLVFYQPIVALKTGELAGFEALIRWNHPERGLVSPGEFIPIAEETGLIFPIGEWMLRESCRQLAAWQRSHSEAESLWVAVNVSAKQFMQADVESSVSHVLNETGLLPGSLKLELTETAMAENLEHVAEVMKRLKALGVKLSIDDFGTGYSSLSNLHKLPLDSLKIDRSFVNHMVEGIENREIIRTIVSLAGSLGLDVVAEGVETEQQLMELRRLDCDQGQGFYFAPPLDAAAAETLIGYSRMSSVVLSSFVPQVDTTAIEMRPTV
jgi:diguanylate cyclase (GGDEF)-like protein/PAS domain S-box-containing protein